MPAGSKFRAIPLLIAGRKFAECNGTVYTAQSGDEQCIGADGVLGLSEGIPILKIEADFVQPVSGTKIDIYGMFVNKTEFVAQQPIGGKSHGSRMRITDISITSETKNGTCKGKITMMNASDLDITG